VRSSFIVRSPVNATCLMVTKKAVNSAQQITGIRHRGIKGESQCGDVLGSGAGSGGFECSFRISRFDTDRPGQEPAVHGIAKNRPLGSYGAELKEWPILSAVMPRHKQGFQFRAILILGRG